MSAEADLRLLAVIGELEAAAGEPAYANPGLGLVARVIVYGCRHTFDRQGMTLFIQRKPWMRHLFQKLIEKYRVDQAELTGMFAAVDPGAGSWGAHGAGSWDRMSWGVLMGQSMCALPRGRVRIASRTSCNGRRGAGTCASACPLV